MLVEWLMPNKKSDNRIKKHLPQSRLRPCARWEDKKRSVQMIHVYMINTNLSESLCEKEEKVSAWQPYVIKKKLLKKRYSRDREYGE